MNLVSCVVDNKAIANTCTGEQGNEGRAGFGGSTVIISNKGLLIRQPVSALRTVEA